MGDKQHAARVAWATIKLIQAGPRRYRVHTGGRPVGSGKGCSVDMYLLALALGRPVHAERPARPPAPRSRWTSPPRGWSASTR